MFARHTLAGSAVILLVACGSEAENPESEEAPFTSASLTLESTIQCSSGAADRTLNPESVALTLTKVKGQVEFLASAIRTRESGGVSELGETILAGVRVTAVPSGTRPGFNFVDGTTTLL